MILFDDFMRLVTGDLYDDFYISLMLRNLSYYCDNTVRGSNSYFGRGYLSYDELPPEGFISTIEPLVGRLTLNLDRDRTKDPWFRGEKFYDCELEDLTIEELMSLDWNVCRASYIRKQNEMTYRINFDMGVIEVYRWHVLSDLSYKYSFKSNVEGYIKRVQLKSTELNFKSRISEVVYKRDDFYMLHTLGDRYLDENWDRWELYLHQLPGLLKSRFCVESSDLYFLNNLLSEGSKSVFASGIKEKSEITRSGTKTDRRILDVGLKAEESEEVYILSTLSQASNGGEVRG